MAKLFWIAHCGNHAINRTSQMIEVEHFTDAAIFQRRLNQIEMMHGADFDALESYTYGEIDPATGKEG